VQSSRPLKTIGLSLWVLILFINGCGGTKTLPPHTEGLLERWLLAPNQQRLDSLCALPLDCQKLDSLIAVGNGRRRGAADSSVTLTDLNGQPFVLGILPGVDNPHSRALPLIIYLHGGIGTSRTDKGVNAYTMLSPLADSMPLYLASPSANRLTPWWSSAGLERILQSVRYMCLHYPIDAERIFLVGVSDGATGCYAAANTIPAPFAGFIAISGFGGMLPRVGLPLAPSNLMQRPIYNVQAGLDRLYPLEMVNAFLDELYNHGVNVERTVYPDERHGFDYREREWPALLKLLREWKRPAQHDEFSWTLIPGLPNRVDNILSLSAIPTPSQPPTINGFWRQDTLIVVAHNLSEVTLQGYGAADSPRWLRLNELPARPLKPSRHPLKAQLEALQKSGTLQTSSCNPVFTIKLSQ
jgi:acetyl esterase/lipase